MNELEFRLTSPMSLKKQVPLALFDPDLKAAEPENLVVVELGRRGVYSPGPGVGAKTGFAASCRSFCFFFRDLGVRCIVLALSPADRSAAYTCWTRLDILGRPQRRQKESAKELKAVSRRFQKMQVGSRELCTT